MRCAGFHTKRASFAKKNKKVCGNLQKFAKMRLFWAEINKN